MQLEFTPDQLALQDQLRAYFGELMSEDRKKAIDVERMGKPYRETVRQMGKDGWLGVGWPKEYGGQGFGPIEQLIFLQEAARAGAPIPMVTLNTVGPTIAVFGSDEVKDYFLPKILSGEVHFAIGYTEPEAGTDLASLRTKAVRDGDEYIVNGQKIFTTGGHDSDFIWLACRTNPDVPKHKGISILLVDCTSPGFKWTPIHVLGGGHTNATYYEDVRVPVSRRVGEENGGWKMITTQLNFERVAFGPAAGILKDVELVAEWARATEAPEGGTVFDREWVRLNLARVKAKAEVAELFNWRVAALQDKGELNPADASVMKVYGTDLRIESARLLMEILGRGGTLREGSAGAMLKGRLEKGYRHAVVGTFGGGVNEIQREIIGMAGLRLPRVPRDK